MRSRIPCSSKPLRLLAGCVAFALVMAAASAGAEEHADEASDDAYVEGDIDYDSDDEEIGEEDPLESASSGAMIEDMPALPSMKVSLDLIADVVVLRPSALILGIATLPVYVAFPLPWTLIDDPSTSWPTFKQIVWQPVKYAFEPRLHTREAW